MKESQLYHQWSVRHETDAFLFTNFETAMAYADGFISNRKLIKHIHPDQHCIVLLEHVAAPRSYCGEDVHQVDHVTQLHEAA